MNRFLPLMIFPVIGSLMAIAASVPMFPSSASEIDDYCATNPYGIDGEISQADLNDLAYFAYPQTVGDLRNRFGSPKCMSQAYDLYKVAESDTWIGFEFEGYQAIGYRVWEAGQ